AETIARLTARLAAEGDPLPELVEHLRTTFGLEAASVPRPGARGSAPLARRGPRGPRAAPRPRPGRPGRGGGARRRARAPRAASARRPGAAPLRARVAACRPRPRTDSAPR